MTDASLIERLEAENDLLSPAAKTSGTVNPIAAMGLLGTAGLMAFMVLGSGTPTAGAMTDPTDETWHVSSMTIGTPEDVLDATRKTDNRLRLTVPSREEKPTKAATSVEAEPELESFEVPAPEVSFDLADMPADDAAVPVAAPATPAVAVTEAPSPVRTIEGITFSPAPTASMAPVAAAAAPVEQPEEAVAALSTELDDDIVAMQESLPSMEPIDRAAPTGAMAATGPQPMEGGSGATFEVIGTDDATNDGGEEKWRRYRSGMIVFDASNGAPAAATPSVTVIEQDMSGPAARVGGNYGYFSGARD